MHVSCCWTHANTFWSRQKCELLTFLLLLLHSLVLLLQVPVYHFGNTQCLSFGPSFLERWGRRWRFSLGILYGIALLPIPRRVRLLMVVGSPVKVQKTSRNDPHFQSVVDSTHQAYMDALQALYDKHKGLYGWQDHPLVMH